jgi:glutathione synthase/RimK-type ligase-like ATP-grasp enzyme
LGVTPPPFPDPCYAFIRVNQGGERLVNELALHERLAGAGYSMIIGSEDTRMYEDKVAQSKAYASWLPPTLVLEDREDALAAVEDIDLPFVSKSRTGSASRNVRLITTRAQARAEIEAAFGRGLEAPHKLGELVQKGYLIWQSFCPGNAYDYRVCKIGRRIMILRRYNRDDVPFASGSGKTEAVTALNAETSEVYDFAAKFFEAIGTNWCGIDVVRGRGGWRLLETTIGWSQKAYADCTFFNSRRKGAEMWELVCDEVEAGVFDRGLGR